MKQTTTRQRRDPVYVFIRRPRCPECASVNLHTQRSEANGDGTTTRHTICKTCSARFRLVIE